MNAAEKARELSDKCFKVNYKTEIEFIEKNIYIVVKEGFRSVWIDSSDGMWVGESVVQTKRLIEHFKEQGFKVKIVGTGGMAYTEWKDGYKGIEVSWA